MRAGYTPLHMAVGYSHVATVAALLEAGADPEVGFWAQKTIRICPFVPLSAHRGVTCTLQAQENCPIVRVLSRWCYHGSETHKRAQGLVAWGAHVGIDVMWRRQVARTRLREFRSQ